MYAAAYRNTERGARPMPVDALQDGIVVRTVYPRRGIQVVTPPRPNSIDALRAERERKQAEAARLVDEAVAKYRTIICVASRPDAKQIIRTTAEAHGFTYGEVVGKRRHKPLIVARHACMRAVADARPDWTLPMIGRVFHCDHTTILHALKKTREPGAVR